MPYLISFGGRLIRVYSISNAMTNCLPIIFTQSLPKVPQYVASLYAAAYLKTGDIRGMLDEMYRSLQYGIFYTPQDKLDFIRNFLRHVETCGNETFMNEANAWVN